jgi:membrane-bound lytic murein transglycosylase B
MTKVRVRLCAVLWLALSVGASAQPYPSQAPLEPARPNFDQWLADLRAEAVARGYSAALVEQALGALEPLPIVIRSDRSQAERTLAVDDYLARRVTTQVVRTARSMADRHRVLLKRIERQYGIPSSMLIAVWGLESNFGRFSGARPTLAALATLAHDPRRGTFFRAQIFDALTIVDRGDIELTHLKGSWAGAMGQPQFLPSSYLRYAVDFDGDGRRDIWESHADIFASIANYLLENGWQKGERWGREVRLSGSAETKVDAAAPLRMNGCEAVRGMTQPIAVSDWRRAGVKWPDGRPLPVASMEASLVRAGARSFIVYRNYEALLRYNCAHTYALSIATLADRVSGAPARQAPKKSAASRY